MGMGSDVNHFNVSLIVQGQSHETVSTNLNFFVTEKGEPKWGLEPACVLPHLPAERLTTTRPSRLTSSFRILPSSHGKITERNVFITFCVASLYNTAGQPEGSVKREVKLYWYP